MIWIILELALANRRLQSCLTNLINHIEWADYMKQVVYHCFRAAQIIHSFPVFSYLWPFSWKLKARLAAKGLQHRPRMFFLHLFTTRVGPRKDCGPCGPCALVPLCAVSFFFHHPHLLPVLCVTLRNASRQVSKLHSWSAALRSSIWRGSYNSGEDMWQRNG